MTLAIHDNAVRTGVRRVSLTKVDDTGDQQFVDGDGFDGDSPRGMVRVQPHGFASNPPTGSEGLALGLGGRSDRLHMIGGEHPDHKPKNLPVGATAMYSDKSAIMKMIGDDISISADGTATWTVKSLTIKCGGVTVAISGSGVKVTGGQVTHEDHDIGATHKHTGVQPGPGLSDVPA